MSDPPPDAESATEKDATVQDEPTLDVRGLLVATGLGIALLVAVIAALGYWFRGPLTSASESFVQALGGPGIAVGFFIPDAFTIPVPNDAFSTLGIAGGLGFWEVVGWGTLGSLVGGSTGWLIGSRLGRTRFVGGFLTGRGARLSGLIRRYGVVMVGIAAISPLPYSISAWAAGAVQMPFGVFISVSALRVFRVAGALYLIQLGLMGTS